MTKYSLILLIFFTTVSCLPQLSRQDAPPVCLTDGADRAAFDVDEVEYEFTRLADSSNEDVLKSDFLIKFKACIKDSFKKQPMRNRTFAIHTFSDQRWPEEKVKDTLCENVEWGCVLAPTDNDGCLKWSEKYNFALPAEQKWIGFKRVIAHRSGSRVVPMMINPWVPDPKVVDLRPQFGDENDYLADNKTVFYLHDEREKLKLHGPDQSALDKCKEEGSLDQAFKHLDEHAEKAFLWVEEIEFSPSRKVRPTESNYKEIYNICDDSLTDEQCNENESLDRKGGFLKLDLKIYVHVTSDDESGRIKREYVTPGSEFNVTAYLLSQVEGDSSDGNGTKFYMLHRPMKTMTAIAGSEYIRLDNAILHIPYETTEGTSVILLKVESRGEENMEPFYGVYDINDKSVRDLHGTSMKLSLKSSESSPDQLLDLDKVSISKVESARERIKEYKEMFDRFDQGDADDIYAQYKPTVGEYGFDYSKGLALDLSRMRFARIKASGDTCSSPVSRWVVYLGEVCLRDPRINQYLEKRPVTVTAQDMVIDRDSEDRIVVGPDPKEKIRKIVDNRRADERGCIQFTYELSHKLYDVQKYFMKKLTFSTGDLEESKYIGLNPWEYGFLTYQEFTQAYENWHEADEVYGECKKTQCSKLESLEDSLKVAESDLEGAMFSENLDPPVLRLNEYRNVIIEPSYKIESSLDVQTIKNLQMFLQPSVVRRDSPGEDIWQIPRVLPIGYYLVRFIIAKGPQETAEGKELILDRASLNPLEGGLRLIEDMDFITHQKSFARTFEKLTTPTSTANENLSLDALDERTREFEQALSKVKDVYQETGYDAYGEHLKTANATQFFGSGCEAGDRVSCFTKDDYIAHFDTLAYSENGVLSTFVKFGFNVEHFRHLGSKNSILIEIYPTDPGEYQYLSPERPGANRCNLDIENTTFKPFPTCAEGEAPHEGCHQLRTPAHWGLFFTTEFGMVNIVWPTERNYSEVFDLNPIAVSGKSKYQMDVEKQQLTIMENALNHVNNQTQRGSVRSDWNRTAKAYSAHFDRFVDSMDRVDINSFNQYCKGIEEQISSISSSDLKGVESLPEELALGLYVCSANLEDSESPIPETTVRDQVSGTTIQHQIRKYFTYRDFSKERKRGVDPLKEYMQVQAQEGSFCDERSHKATTYIDHGNDLSESDLDYQDCVCSPPNEESLTKKMARCFAKTQGLVFVENNMDFLAKLDNARHSRGFEANGENLTQVVQHSKDVNLELSEDFLQSMCTFWFTEYYKNYLTFDHVENLYNKSISELEFLYNNEYIRVAEEYQFEDVRFDDFKNISRNGSAVAQWFQGIYRSNGYEPFMDHNKISDTTHPFYICRRDPLKFFHIERKVVVGELDTYSNETEYKNGRVYSLTTQASMGAQARVEHSERQQIASSVRGELRIETPKEFLGKGFAKVLRLSSSGFNEILRASFGTGVGAEAARTGTVSSTEYNTSDSTKSILLAVNHVEVDLALKRHRSCLVIRPKTNAFEDVSNSSWKNLSLFWSSNLPSQVSEDAVSLMRAPYTDSGLLICDKESLESRVVPENYYYIHQFFGGHAYEFMSRTIYHNRPYTEIIRGQEQMDKFISLTHSVAYNRESKLDNPFGMNALIKHLSLDRDQIDRNLVESFERNALDWSGFYKGIYTYPDLINYYDSDKAKSKGFFDRVMDLGGNWVAVPQESIH
ncbi:MAG: hypothetical protein OXK80_02445 [Bdellovibrionales bacterium]|nr:hypothetical protein [Bdellovibrionales bacterium]